MLVAKLSCLSRRRLVRSALSTSLSCSAALPPITASYANTSRTDSSAFPQSSASGVTSNNEFLYSRSPPPTRSHSLSMACWFAGLEVAPSASTANRGSSRTIVGSGMSGMTPPPPAQVITRKPGLFPAALSSPSLKRSATPRATGCLRSGQ